jgi:hypothetical protein
VFTADDIGGQDGLLISLKMWEQFIKPYHVRLNAAIHEHGDGSSTTAMAASWMPLLV